jgi:hypothetical protein
MFGFLFAAYRAQQVVSEHVAKQGIFDYDITIVAWPHGVRGAPQKRETTEQGGRGGGLWPNLSPHQMFWLLNPYCTLSPLFKNGSVAEMAQWLETCRGTPPPLENGFCMGAPLPPCLKR